MTKITTPQKINHKDFNFRGWHLDDSAFKKMKELTKKSKETGLEHGGLLCGDKETLNVKLEHPCTGTSCEIELGLFSKRKCKDLPHPVGTFHTHPKQSVPILSIADIKSKQGIFDCLGTSNKIICHTIKSTLDDYWNERQKQESKLNRITNTGLLS